MKKILKNSNNKILDTYAFLKDKNINDICYSVSATQKFSKKNHLGVFL